jgi:hypothetical protein
LIKQQQQQGGPQTYYLKPMDYWNDLGALMKQICNAHPYMSTKEGIFAMTLRELAYMLFCEWCEHLTRIKDNKPKVDFIATLKQLVEKKYATEQQLKAVKAQSQMTYASQTMLGNLVG